MNLTDPAATRLGGRSLAEIETTTPGAMAVFRRRQLDFYRRGRN